MTRECRDIHPAGDSRRRWDKAAARAGRHGMWLWLRHNVYRLAALIGAGGWLLTLLDRILHALTGTSHGGAGW